MSVYIIFENLLKCIKENNLNILSVINTLVVYKVVRAKI